LVDLGNFDVFVVPTTITVLLIVLVKKLFKFFLVVVLLGLFELLSRLSLRGSAELLLVASLELLW